MTFVQRPTLERPSSFPLRTVLFVQGSDELRVEEAPETGADAIMLDLEEPETPMSEAARTRAQSVVGEFLRSLPADRAPDARPRCFVRTRAPSTGFMWEDLRAVIAPHLSGVVVPKVEGPEDIVAADALLLAAEIESGLPRGSLRICPLLETASGLRLAYEVAMASPRVAYLGGMISRFGDVHQALGYRWTAKGRETLFVRSKVLLDAKSAGIRYPIGGLWGGDADDLDGLRVFAYENRELGYYGMMLGNADHVGLVQEIFTPTPDEVRYWTELVTLAEEAESKGEGPILYGDPNGEGHVVQLAHVASARMNLEWARALGIS